MAKAFKNLLKDMSPERLNRIEERVEQILIEMALQEIRQHRQLTQTEIADNLAVNQSAVSKMESQQDMHVSTLRKIITAMGGVLKVIAKFPDEEIVISQFGDDSSTSVAQCSASQQFRVATIIKEFDSTDKMRVIEAAYRVYDVKPTDDEHAHVRLDSHTIALLMKSGTNMSNVIPIAI